MYEKGTAILGSLLVVVLLILIYLTAEKELSIKQEMKEMELDWFRKEEDWNAKLADIERGNKELKKLADDPYGGRTLTLENKLVQDWYVPSDRHAIVTMVGFPSSWHPYWMGAIGLIQSLRESQTRIPHIVVMVRDGSEMPKVAKKAYENLGAELIYIENFDLESLDVDIPGTWGVYRIILTWILLFWTYFYFNQQMHLIN